ncbi:pentapeptide repeat-containing protein [Vibrio parahaemolyticus]|uniref:pentapeptide repeat-containing protein n=1 Tax=Vibrio cholerae TaxID=666 RepID=UPI00155E1DCF|nr:pentapeptide repeat-containing protein [Vibrio parahaemolyticus]MCR9654140.1 pentapeptide repeat-containing protein [Vibrio parahaemolyticus]NOE11959.1 hypothetical protein [Vibrio cholerae]
MSKKTISQLIQEHPVMTMVVIGAIAASVIVWITAYWEVVSTTVLAETTMGLYNRAFWENFLVEAHGFLLDFIVFGVLVFSLDRLRSSREVTQKLARQKQEEKERMEEELSDYAALDMPELNLRKIGHIKRLQRSGVERFDITQLTINACNIKGLVFSAHSRLIGMQLQNGHMNTIKFEYVSMKSSFFNGTTIRSCVWNNCDLRKLVLKDCKAKGTTFVDCQMAGADLRNADLTGAVFTNSSMENVKFEGAILNRVDFRGVSGLDARSLSTASSVDYILVDLEILEQLKELKPDMNLSGQRGIEPPHQQIDCMADTIMASDDC